MVVASLIVEIKTFISIQRRLTEALLDKYPECRNYLLLFNLPKCGEVILNGVHWNYKKHGSGVEFRCSDGRVVDVCERLDEPDLFSEWRISLYLQSVDKDVENLQVDLLSLRQSGHLVSSRKFPGLLTLSG